MNPFRRNNATNTAIPEDLQPYYTTEQPAWKRWLKTIARLLLLLLLLGLLIWGALWVIDKLNNRNAAQTNDTTELQKSADEAQNEAAQKAAEAKAKSDAAEKAARAKAAEDARKQQAAGGAAGGVSSTQNGATSTRDGATESTTGGGTTESGSSSPAPVLPKSGG